MLAYVFYSLIYNQNIDIQYIRFTHSLFLLKRNLFILSQIFSSSFLFTKGASSLLRFVCFSIFNLLRSSLTKSEAAAANTALARNIPIQYIEFMSHKIVETIPYNKLRHAKHLLKQSQTLEKSLSSFHLTEILTRGR